MSQLVDRVAIITGASSGIGAAVARELSGRGMRLVLTGRQQDRLDVLAAELGSGSTALLAADVTDPQTPRSLLDLALNTFGRCDVVFNGAGVMHVGTIEDVDVDQMCQMVRVNVEAFTRMAYAALKHFRTVNSGHLINVSSILGTKVRPTTGVYAGTKYFVEAFSEALRMEVAKSNVQVSVIQPGLVATRLQDHFEVHPRQSQGIEHPLMPEDIARCVGFVLEQPAHVRIPILMAIPGEQPL